ncbi:MAG: hypothetical protein OSB70_00705 [Myxococcota bacterium]|nr:hypothetical protein [Myxococcota bacterium]
MSRVEWAITVGWLLIVGLGLSAYLSESPAAPAEVLDFRAEQQGVRALAGEMSSYSEGSGGHASGMNADDQPVAGSLDGRAKGLRIAKSSATPTMPPRYRDDPRSDRSRSFAQVGQFGSPSGNSYGGLGGRIGSNSPAESSSWSPSPPRSSASAVAYEAETGQGFAPVLAPSAGGGFGQSSSSWDGAARESYRPEPPTAYAYHDEQYYCRTAREIREACENGGLQPERYDFCLSFGGYYGNSRFCGYHP